MELSEFISTTLREIFKGVQDVVNEQNTQTYSEGAIGRGRGVIKNQYVSFDISVSSEEASSKEGGAGIRVIDYFKADGSLSKSSVIESANRIQFRVPITYPKKPNPDVGK